MMPISDWPVEYHAHAGCWLWRSKTTTRGYAPYREVYEAEVGPVPEGKELDHECRIRACVAPYHLRAVTRRENMKRQRWSYRVKIRWCPEGHDMSRVSIRTEYGGRVCGVCSGVRREV